MPFLVFLVGLFVSCVWSGVTNWYDFGGEKEGDVSPNLGSLFCLFVLDFVIMVSPVCSLGVGVAVGVNESTKSLRFLSSSSSSSSFSLRSLPGVIGVH